MQFVGFVKKPGKCLAGSAQNGTSVAPTGPTPCSYRMTKPDLASDAAQAEAAYRQRASEDFLFFVQGVVIPSAHGPVPFGDCIADFQMDFFRDLSPSLHAIREGDMPPKRRFWMERTKKAAKDSDLALCILWLMAFSRKPLKIQVCAAHQRQAGIIRGRVLEIIHWNPWLNRLVEVQQNSVVNRKKRSTVWTRIEATDSKGGAHGETPDLLILNELVHVAKWQAMEDHMNNADGVPMGVVVVSTNAGVKGTKAELWRKNALANKERWSVHIWNKRSPWVSEADVAEAKRRDPIGAEFKRLWQGLWISGSGGAVDDAMIDGCFVLDGPVTAPELGYQYVAGLDLGVSHDHSGAIVVGVNRVEQLLKVGYLKGWEPSIPNDKNKLEVDSKDVEKTCLMMQRTFNLKSFWYDPAAGGSFMAQRLRSAGLFMKEMSFSSPKNLTDMATCFVQVVKDGRLQCYDDVEGRLRRDMGKFSIVHVPPSGYKLKAVSDEYGHADVGTALVICLPQAVELMGGLNRLMPDDEIAMMDNKPLTQKEIDDMPDDLREFYDVCDDIEKEHTRGSRVDDWDDAV